MIRGLKNLAALFSLGVACACGVRSQTPVTIRTVVASTASPASRSVAAISQSSVRPAASTKTSFRRRRSALVQLVPAQRPARATSSCTASWFRSPKNVAAHRTLPFGTKVRVSFGTKSVVVTIGDRGPFIAGRQIDLDDNDFARLAPLGAGVIDARCEVLA